MVLSASLLIRIVSECQEIYGDFAAMIEAFFAAGAF